MTANGISICLLVRSLEMGGAERQLVELARGLHRRGCRVMIATFYKRGALVGDLNSAGVPIIDLQKKGRWDLLGFFLRTCRAIRDARPDFLYSFLGGANIVAALVRPFAPRLRLVWSIRASDMDLAHYDWSHRATYSLERRLARAADLIISNSRAGRDFAVRHGFPRERIVVVANGIDTKRFRPDAALRRKQRSAWGIGPRETAIGLLARLDPMKGQDIFLAAAARAVKERSDLRFLCIGEGREGHRLRTLAAELGLGDRVVFTGLVDASSALNALDIACSTSTFGEGFSNAVAEAMACGLPCVVTDVGDSALIVGETGVIVPPSDSEALALALLKQAKGLPRHDGGAARRRVVQNFSTEAMIDQTIRALNAIRSTSNPREI